MKLTYRQAQVLTAILDHITVLGRPPTLREIGAKLDISSTNCIHEHLSALERKEYIVRDRDNGSRCIRILKLANGERVRRWIPVTEEAAA